MNQSEQYKIILNNIVDGVIVASIEDMRIVYANKRMADLLGLSEEDVLKKSIQDVHPKSAVLDATAIFEEMAGGEANDVQAFPIQRQDGTILYCDISANLIEWENQKCLLGLFHDVTYRCAVEDRLRDSEERFKTIFEANRDGIVVVDAETKKFVLANQRICEMLDYVVEDITQMSVTDIHPADSLEMVLESFEKQRSGEKYLAENIPVKRRDHTVFYADIASAFVRVGDQDCLVGVFRDITQRQEREKQLKQKIHDLEVFHKAAVDREMVIKDLKIRVSELEKELQE